MKTRIDFTPAWPQDEARREERIDELRERRQPFKSVKKRRIRNLTRARVERAALDAAWNASRELTAAQARLERAQADYAVAYQRAIACTDAYLSKRGIKLDRNGF